MKDASKLKQQDQQMKDVSKEKEEVKEHSDRGTLGHWKDFDEMSRSIWDDYSRLDQEMDKRFRHFSDLMFKNRELQLEDFKREAEKKPMIKGEGQKALGQQQKAGG